MATEIMKEPRYDAEQSSFGLRQAEEGIQVSDVFRKMRIFSLIFGLLLTGAACQSQAPVPTATSEPTCTPFAVNGPFRIRDVIIYVDEIFWARSIPENVTITKATAGAGLPSVVPPYSDPGFLSQSRFPWNRWMNNLGEIFFGALTSKR